MEAVIIGAGIGGLTLGLMLDRAGIPFRIHEAAPTIKPIGVGITLLPHANQILGAPGAIDAIESTGVITRESRIYTRHRQLVHQEAHGTLAGDDRASLAAGR